MFFFGNVCRFRKAVELSTTSGRVENFHKDKGKYVEDDKRKADFSEKAHDEWWVLVKIIKNKYYRYGKEVWDLYRIK